MGKKKKKEASALRSELENYYLRGVELRLDGHPSSPKEIVKACHLAENGFYMRDYVQNDRGEVVWLSFDKVKEEK